MENIATVQFPSGTFSESVAVQILKTSDADTAETFYHTAIIYDVENSLNYEVRIVTGVLINGNITAVLNIPATMFGSIPSGYEVGAFIQLYQDGGEETLDNFYRVPATYTSETNTVQIEMSDWSFTNKRNADNKFEAVITLGMFPKPPEGSFNLANQVTPMAKPDYCDCFSSPLNNDWCYISSGYGWRRSTNSFHKGVDFTVPAGTHVVLPAANGVVKWVGWDYKEVKDKEGKVIKIKGWGNYIVIEHTCLGRRYFTRYAHLITPPPYKEGDIIDVGQGRMIPGIVTGNSGGSTGPHLHFEIFPKYDDYAYKFTWDPEPCVTCCPEVKHSLDANCRVEVIPLNECPEVPA